VGEPRVPPRSPSFGARGGSLLSSGESAVSPARPGGQSSKGVPRAGSPKSTRVNEISAIETARLLLRRPGESDVEPWTKMLADPAVARYLGPPLGDRASVVAHMLAALERDEVDGFGMLTIERKQDHRAIGRSGFLVWDRRTWTPTTLLEADEHAEVEIGWTLARDCWGRGYATEAGAACRDSGFHSLGRDRIIAVIQPGNGRSMAVARRLGMQWEMDTRTAKGFDVQVWVAHRGERPMEFLTPTEPDRFAE
jgi:RimJ/RimL family protein N-acetyltransferase